MPTSLIVLALIASLGPVMADPPPVEAARARNGCSVSATQRRPPSTIRVYRTRSGHITRVPFYRYVERVVASEWGSTPNQLRRAGAVVVKQYAWSKALRPRRAGSRCFDVFDSTRDQIYRHKAVKAQVAWAVRTSWHITLRHRDGRLVHTGYRTGAQGKLCAQDAGRRLMARSAKKCANKGWSASRILATYYRNRGVRVRY